MQGDKADEGKTVAESASEMVQIVLPNDTNMLGNLLGGTDPGVHTSKPHFSRSI